MKNIKKKKSDKKTKKLKIFKHWKKGSIFEKILTIIMIFLVFCFICGITFMGYIVIFAPDFDVEKLYTTEASIVYDSDLNIIARLGTENRERVTYEDLPEVFIDALIATEDSRFFQHNGVDLARFAKATFGQLLGKSGAGGASTLTMQIVKQRYTGNAASGIKGIIRKFTDVYMSIFKIEKNYTKEQIIEYYVNIPELGSGAFGVEQASKIYFGKSISEVSLTEAALLAGLFQAPSAYNPYSSPKLAESRRNQVLNLMKRHGYITDTECELAKAISVKSLLNKDSNNANENQGFINTVISEVEKRTGKNPYYVPMKIYTTMIQEKQNVVNDIYTGKTYKWANDYIQGGVAVTDIKTGALIAVGASRKKGARSYNYATMIDKHPGSTAKPIFDYGPAIEYLNWSTGQTIVDDAYSYSNGGYMKNWDNGYKGILTIKEALAKSRNIPALQAFQAVGQSNIKKFVTNLGITPQYDKVGYINESHSIGGFNGTNPLQMSAAFGAFARGGIYIEPYSFTKIEFMDSGEIYTVTPQKRKVMSDSTAYMISMILKYAVTSNEVTAGSKSGTDVCSKTGTSTVDANFKKSVGITGDLIGDSWQVTFTPDYSYAVWVGYDEITKEHYLTRSTGSSARKKISSLLTSGIAEPNSRFVKPDSVVKAVIERETIPLTLASEFTPDKLKSEEYFKKGTVPEEVSTRFSQLENPTNLKSNYTIGSVELTWDPIKKPDAIDDDYLNTYFTEGYKTFAEKYLRLRKEYNAANIGTNGYHVYIKNSNGSLTDLGFTTKNSYTYTGALTTTTTFVVKSSYSIFKNNMSSGVSTTVNPAGETIPAPTNNWIINIKGNLNMTLKEFLELKNSSTPFLNILDEGKDVTKYATISTVCFLEDEEINCANLECNQTYTLQHTAHYNKQNKTVTRTISKSC